MKKLLIPLIICIIACILFSSCSSPVSIAKRHYRKGYYIEYAKHTPATQPSKEEEKTVQAGRRMSLHSIPYPAKQNIIEGYVNDDPEPGHLIVITSAEKMQHNRISQQNVKQILLHPIDFTENTILQHKQLLSENNEYDDGSTGHAALSLLWIVILVILILWLIGILGGRFGLGGLINILLVIALVLLILWLLRIA